MLKRNGLPLSLTSIKISRDFSQTFQLGDLRGVLTGKRRFIPNRTVAISKFRWSSPLDILPSKIAPSYKKVMNADSLRLRSSSAQRNGSAGTNAKRRALRRNSNEPTPQYETSTKRHSSSISNTLVISFSHDLTTAGTDFKDLTGQTDERVQVKPRMLRLDKISEIKEDYESDEDEVGNYMTSIELRHKPARAQTVIESGFRRLVRKNVKKPSYIPLGYLPQAEVVNERPKFRPVNIKAVVPRVLEVTSV